MTPNKAIPIFALFMTCNLAFANVSSSLLKVLFHQETSVYLDLYLLRSEKGTIDELWIIYKYFGM